MTTVRQTFNFSNVPLNEDGITSLSIDRWSHTLSTVDKIAYKYAQIAREAAVQQQIELGNLTIEADTGAYIWVAGADKSSVVLPEWEIFFNRFTSENGITFSESSVDL